jgi:predicted alpha/beta hydrolase family esterase
VNVLVLPGWRNSGPEHWQSHWERAQPAYHRVEQRDWEWPARDEWIATLEQEITASDSPVVLAAHSLGCVAAAAWAVAAPATSRAHVAGAFLLAPADVDRALQVSA